MGFRTNESQVIAIFGIETTFPKGIHLRSDPKISLTSPLNDRDKVPSAAACSRR